MCLSTILLAGSLLFSPSIESDSYTNVHYPEVNDFAIKHFYNEFILYANKYNKLDSIKKYRLLEIKIQPLSGNTVGKSYKLSNNSGIIIIDLDKMDDLIQLRAVLFHELGHFYLDKDHIDCDICIMKSAYNFKKTPYELQDNWLEHLEELFS